MNEIKCYCVRNGVAKRLYGDGQIMFCDHVEAYKLPDKVSEQVFEEELKKMSLHSSEL